jgi:hypothetical protein
MKTNSSTQGMDRRMIQIESMVEIGFHLGCEKLEKRRLAAVTDGLKDYPSAAVANKEPRIWPAEWIPHMVTKTTSSFSSADSP